MKRFNWPAFLIGLAILMSALTDVASAVECFPSQEAARAAHPGASWYSYRGTGSHKRWYAGKTKLRCDAPETMETRHSRKRARTETKAAEAPVVNPLPSMTGGAVTETAIQVTDLLYFSIDYGFARRTTPDPALTAASLLAWGKRQVGWNTALYGRAVR